MKRILHLVPQWPTKYQTFVLDDIEISKQVFDSIEIFGFNSMATGIKRQIFWAQKLLFCVKGVLIWFFRRKNLSHHSGIYLNPKMKIQLLAIVGSKPWVLEDSFVIHSHFLAHTSDVAAQLRSQNENIFLIATAHGAEVLMNEEPKLIEIASHQDYIVCASRAVMDSLIAQFHAHSRELRVDILVRYCRTHEVVKDITIPQLSKTPIFLVSVGRMHPQKGWEMCLTMAQVMKKNGIDFRWRFIGDGENFEQIKRLIMSFSLETEIELLGWKPRSFCLEIMSTSRFTVLPSIKHKKDCDGLPLVILEAMRAGSIVISNDLGGISEAIGNNRGIFLKDSVQDTILEMQNLLLSSHSMEEIVKNAKNWVIENTDANSDDPLIAVYRFALDKLTNSN